MRGADGEKEAFFHCLDRVPSGIHIDTDHPSDDDDDEEEARASFSSAMGDHNFQSFLRPQAGALLEDEDQEPEPEMEDASKYDMWMSDEPMCIQERRRRQHQGLGMVSSRDLALRRHRTKKRFIDVPRSVSRRMQQMPPSLPVTPAANTPAPSVATETTHPPPSGLAAAREMLKQPPAKPITRRRSDGFLAVRDGSGKPSLRRARSLLSPHDPCSSSLIDKFKATRDMPAVTTPASAPADKGTKGDGDDGGQTKKHDNSKEGAVMAAPKDQNQTGVQLGLEEIEKFIGNTTIMKHLMRRGPSQHHSQPTPPSALSFRLLYILKRLSPISVFLLEKDAEHFSSHDVLVKRVQAAFNRFAESTEQSCRERCMEDLESTTRYVTWFLHSKNRAGLRHFLDSFVAPEQLCANTHTAHSAVLHEQSSGLNDNKQDRPKGELKSSHTSDSNPSGGVSETRLVDLLDSTLWNRRLAPSSERLVYALVHQIFHGIKEHFLVTTELKFNCFLLMPIVDKLAALLREDLESAFEDDLDSIFSVTQLRHSLGQKKRELEIELKQMKHLKEKFTEINQKLNSLQVRQQA